jgi:hypothetical protein
VADLVGEPAARCEVVSENLGRVVRQIAAEERGEADEP